MIERELICQQLADEFEKSISDIFLKVSAACFYNRLRSFFVLTMRSSGAWRIRPLA